MQRSVLSVAGAKVSGCRCSCPALLLPLVVLGAAKECLDGLDDEGVLGPRTLTCESAELSSEKSRQASREPSGIAPYAMDRVHATNLQSRCLKRG